MSVEIEGVKGYEYQYLATIYFSLLYIKKESVEIYVEDTEDARIVFGEDTAKQELFIQVKKHDGSITFHDVCSWMGHFGERQSKKFLLSQIAIKNRFAVFFSNGRCEDKTSKFINQDCFELGNKGKFNNQFLEDVKSLLLIQYSTDTTLNAERNGCITEFFQHYSNSEIKTFLKKISLMEQISLEILLNRIAEVLNTKFIIRSSAVDYVIKLLDECVRKGRDNRNDIAPIIRDILIKFSQRILPDSMNYIDVPNQKMYESILEEKNVLLLTGVPFSGKTSLAKAIAQHFAQQGYEVKQTSEFDGDDGALAFLNNYTDDKRLLLLEDPFGSVQLRNDKVECAEKMRKLIMER